MRGYGGRDGATYQSAGVLDHEGRFLGGEVLCCTDEVALVFTRRCVEDDDEAALSFREVRCTSAVSSVGRGREHYTEGCDSIFDSIQGQLSRYFVSPIGGLW